MPDILGNFPIKSMQNNWGAAWQATSLGERVFNKKLYQNIKFTPILSQKYIF